MILPETLMLGKHAFVVLASYGVGLVAIGALIVASLASARRARRALDAETLAEARAASGARTGARAGTGARTGTGTGEAARHG